MEYRKLGRTGLNASIIGLGMEHLAKTSPENIVPVVRRAIDKGLNYIDMMIWQREQKNSLGLALEGRRDEVILAGHLGAAETDGQYRLTRDTSECEELWHDWLSRLNTDCIDVLHLHFIDKLDDYKKIVGSSGILKLALRLKQEGKARFLSLSGHSPAVATRAIKDGHLDVVMQHIHPDDPARMALCHLCASRSVGLVVMKTFGGGAAFERDNPISPVRCISYVLSQPGVCTALAGVKNLQELEAALSFLNAKDEEKDFTSIIGELWQGLEGACVYCNHCLPCPSEIDIPSVIRILVTAQHGVSEQLLANYDSLETKASDCVECEACIERCPFHVEVISKMREAAAIFEASSE